MISKTGSWGDQSDGSFKNPILNADYPDVDVERLGDVYYMITSTIHYAPGMMVLESKDLVNWTIIGHVFDKLDWEEKYGPDQMDGYPTGVWAGDLAYNEGTWYCYFIDASSGLYMSSAPGIRGPWTPAHCMLKKTHWTDPGVLWDHEEGQAYLLCNYGPDPDDPSVGNQARLFKMGWDGRELQDEGRVIYRGPGTEAAKIYKIDGRFYLMMAEWRGNDRKQIVMRGDTIYGPFERRVVMDRRRDLDRSCCQGSLIQAPDDSWWLTHQLVQHREQKEGDLAGPSTTKSYEGRSQWLIPVTWVDGWPIPGEDPEGTGIGKTMDWCPKPIDGLPLASPQSDDHFDAPELGHQWEWNHNPRDEKWSLSARPGWLRLEASVPVGEGGFWKACNTVSQRIMGKGPGTATARLDLAGVKPGQKAGFCHHSGQFVLLGVVAAADGTRRLVFNLDGSETMGPVLQDDILYVRTDIDEDEATCSYGFDGESWTRIGEPFRLTFGRWRGDRLGFYCWNDIEPVGYLDVDWFHYDYDGPKVGGLEIEDLLTEGSL